MADSNGKDTTTDATGGPLDALKQQLEDAVKEARKLANDQADNKRKQDDLKKAIEVFGKNVSGFEDGGDDLRDQYDETLAKVCQEIECMEQHHEDVVAAVDKVVGEVDKAISDRSDAAQAAEPCLFGPDDLDERNKRRAEMFARQAFEALAFDAMKKRVSVAQGWLKDATAAEGKGELGKQYALLWLARRLLKYTSLQSDISTEEPEPDFHFPKDAADYLKQLEAASKAMLDAVRDANAAAHNLKGKQDAYDADKKAFADLRKSRLADILKAAAEAGTEPDGEPDDVAQQTKKDQPTKMPARGR